MRLFIDVQGTLIDDLHKRPLPGAKELICALNEKEIPYLIITNNTKSESKEFLNYLNSVGLEIEESRYIDPLMVLKRAVTHKKVAAFGYENFLNILKSLGYEPDYESPGAVLISVRDDYTFDEFSTMIEFALQGAEIVGMHATSIYVKNDRRYPGVGAILEMIKYAASVNYKVVGKPSAEFYRAALEKLGGGSFSDIVIISDDLKGDLKGAKDLGMKTALVLTGKIRSEREISRQERPDMVFDNLLEAGERLGVL